MANQVMDAVGELADSVKSHAAAGGRSGLNDVRQAGWGNLFGMPQIKSAGKHGKAAWAGAMGARDLQAEKWSGDSMKAMWNGAEESMKGLGGAAWDFFSGAGMKSGLGRAGAIGARGAMFAGAVAAADFLNPFGFGSIRD